MGADPERRSLQAINATVALAMLTESRGPAPAIPMEYLGALIRCVADIAIEASPLHRGAVNDED